VAKFIGVRRHINQFWGGRVTLLRLNATPAPGYGNAVPRLRELFIATPIQICVCAIERGLACGGSAALLFPMAVLVTIDSLRVWESRVSPPHHARLRVMQGRYYAFVPAGCGKNYPPLRRNYVVLSIPFLRERL
jgi:hypothetical protein